MLALWQRKAQVLLCGSPVTKDVSTFIDRILTLLSTRSCCMQWVSGYGSGLGGIWSDSRCVRGSLRQVMEMGAVPDSMAYRREIDRSSTQFGQIGGRSSIGGRFGSRVRGKIVQLVKGQQTMTPCLATAFSAPPVLL